MGAPAPSPPVERPSRFWRFAAVWVLVLATLWIGQRTIVTMTMTADEPRAVTPRGSLGDIESHTVALFEQAAPSVVTIVTEGPRGVRRTGTGSGFVWDRAGHVVTNAHVVEGAARVLVRFDDGGTALAAVVGADPDNDLAVVRLGGNLQVLRPIPVGTSADLRVGQQAFAIGTPFGLSRTLTTGIVSAIDRRLPTQGGREIAGVIQTDAAINPGNSGGPLLDSAGRLIGVNTAILTTTGAGGGIGFAVPVDTVNRVVPALIRDGRVPRPGIGIVVAGEDAAARADVRGLVVQRVVPGGPADRAGLTGADADGRTGDVIVEVGGRPVRTLADLARELVRVGVGGTVQLTVERAGQRRRVDVQVIDIGA
ncbi:MAG: S1C family serine protease [Rhodospirillales bacterium]